MVMVMRGLCTPLLYQIKAPEWLRYNSHVWYVSEEDIQCIRKTTSDLGLLTQLIHLTVLSEVICLTVSQQVQ